MKFSSPHPGLDLKSPSTWLALWGGCGLMKPAPGTWGSIGALPFGILFLVFGNPLVLGLAAVALFFPGVRAAQRVIDATGAHDPKIVVVDEVVGQWLALLPAAIILHPYHILLALALFRLFDIWKPWPVSYFDQKVPDAWGVMADDVAAGIMAAISLFLLRLAGL